MKTGIFPFPTVKTQSHQSYLQIAERLFLADTFGQAYHKVYTAAFLSYGDHNLSPKVAK